MKSFLQDLFDLSFDNFVALTMVRVTFIIGCVAAVRFAGYCAYELQFVNSVLCMVLPPILFIAFVAAFRVTLEMYVALVRIAENTTKLVEMKESKEALPVMRDDQTE